MINIEVFDPNLLKIDKKTYKNLDIYYIGYITIKKIDDYENIYSVNPLYLMIGEVDGHIEEKNESKCLVFESADENRKVFKKKPQNFGVELKMKLRQLMVVKQVSMLKIS